MKKLGIALLVAAMVLVSLASTATVSAATSIKAQEFNGGTAATVNTLNPNFKLVNTGTDPITLSNVKVRYYFTNDGTQANSFACDWATAGNGNITGTFVTVTGATNADCYCEIGFTSAAGTLATGASTEVKTRIWKSDWSNFTQTNDYSFNATATNYVDATNVIVYISGTLYWGTAPGGSGATATPTSTASTATPTPAAGTATPTPTPGTATASPTPTPATATATPTPATSTPTPTSTGLQQKTVRVFWLIPSDVPYDQRIYDGMGNVMKEAQRFYKQELGQTFHLNSTIVEVCYGDHPKAWYETTPNGSDSTWWTTSNLRDEIVRKYGVRADDSRWKIVAYISADGNGCSSQQWVFLPKHDADGAGGLRPEPVGRWYGGMVHELAHAFMLPDSTYTDGTPTSASFYDYPNCHFTDAQKNTLLTAPQNSGFWYAN